MCSIASHNDEETYYTYTYQLINSCALPMVMRATIDMGILKVVHDHAGVTGLCPVEIAALLNLPNPNAPSMLDRMLRLLATYSVVERTAALIADGGLERRYSASPVTKFLVPDNDSVSSLPALLNLLTEDVFLKSWRVVCFSGVEHIRGDMFEDIPEGDAIFLKWILHDWSDDYCLTLLSNCYKALSGNGKVIVVEAILENEVERTNLGRAVSQMDVLMMTQSPGGKERSRQEFEALAKEAGFTSIDFVCCAYTFWLLGDGILQMI